MMSSAKGVLSLVVEGYAPSTAKGGGSGAICTIHIGERSFSLLLGAPGSYRRICTGVLELPPAGKDMITMEIVNDGANEVIGNATFSLARICQTGADRLDVPVISTTTREQLGVFSLCLHLEPAEACTKDTIVAANNAEATAAAASSSSNPLQSSSFVADPGAGYSSTLADASIPPREEPQSSDPSRNPMAAASQDLDDEAAPQHDHREIPTLKEPSALASPAVSAVMEAPAPFSSPFTSAPMPEAFGSPFASTSRAASPAASEAMMAAMAALAALVAAAAELPATRSPSVCGGSATQGLPGLQPAGAGAPAAASYYPPIQPYDAAPPLKFGPGLLPTSSGAAAFYPDIAMRMRISDISLRLQELRPTSSAPLRFGTA